MNGLNGENLLFSTLLDELSRFVPISEPPLKKPRVESVWDRSSASHLVETPLTLLSDECTRSFILVL